MLKVLLFRKLSVMFINQVKMMKDREYVLETDDDNRLHYERLINNGPLDDVDPLNLLLGVYELDYVEELNTVTSGDVHDLADPGRLNAKYINVEGEVIFTYFGPFTPKTTGNSPLFYDDLQEFVLENKVDNIIVFLVKKLTKIRPIRSAVVSYFDYTTIGYSILERVEVTKHELLSKDETKEVLKKYNTSSDKMPKILSTDPYIMHMGWNIYPGRMVKIVSDREIRHSVVNGWVNYRVIYDLVEGFGYTTSDLMDDTD